MAPIRKRDKTARTESMRERWESIRVSGKEFGKTLYHTFAVYVSALPLCLLAIWDQFVTVPTWVWVAFIVLTLVVSAFAVFHTTRIERDALLAKKDGARELLSLRFQLWGALLWEIEYQGAAATKDFDRITSLSSKGGRDAETDAFLSKAHELSDRCRDWEKSTREFIRKDFGVTKQSLFDSDVGIPPLDKPDFDEAKAPIHAGLYRDAQRRIYRLQELIRKLESE